MRKVLVSAFSFCASKSIFTEMARCEAEIDAMIEGFVAWQVGLFCHFFRDFNLLF